MSINNHSVVYAKYPVEQLGLRKEIDYTVDKNTGAEVVTHPEQYIEIFRATMSEGLIELPGKLLDEKTSVLMGRNYPTLQLSIPSEHTKETCERLEQIGWIVQEANDRSLGHINPKRAGPDAVGEEPEHKASEPPVEGIGHSIRKATAST